MADFNLAELQRLLANLIRVGTVEELDEATGKVKVNVSGLTSDWLDVGAQSAGRVRKWSPKQQGEQVVLFAPYGDLSQAVVGFSLFQDAHPANGGSKAQETVTFADGSTVDYNQKTNTLTVSVSGAGNVVVNCKVATVNAETGATFNTPEAKFTGHVTIEQGLAVTGDAIVTGGDVKADEISLKLHKHPTAPPGPLSAPVP